MTPTPPSTNSSSTGPLSPDAQHRIVRKRNRVPLSCAPCRHRKLKCNRASPCDNCIKRGDAPSCANASPGSRKRNQSSAGASSSPDEMQNRIDRLESLVLSLMTNGSQAAGPAAAATAILGSRTAGSLDDSQVLEDDDMNEEQRDEDSDVEQVSRSIGIMKVQNDRQFYASEAHWFAILSDIAEVKSYFAEHKKQYDEQMKKVSASGTTESSRETSLLFKGTAKFTASQILANFPPKPVADKLITRYFNSENPGVRILHGPTFRKEYERHWASPSQTSIVWLGMCFSMMCLAFQSYHRAADEPVEYRGKSWEQSLAFSEWTAQCLVHADYTQPMTHMMETLCFFLQAEYARSRDAETGIWILGGIITRLAMRIGLHRDSKPYASISPFQGEMRRRIWNYIRSADVLLSYACGLPSMIKALSCDTALPSSLFDEEFDVDTRVLPPSRPTTELTPMSYMVAYCQLTFMFGKILEETQMLKQLSYDEIMKLDTELRHVSALVPSHLQHQSAEDSTLDPANLIMQRYSLDLLYHKSQCALHRKYLSRARESPRYAYSRRTCIDACMEMLGHQFTLHAECAPGGRLRAVTWTTTTSLTTHDFLIAAMIVCLDLYHTAQAEAQGHTSGEMYEWAVERREAMFEVIKRAVAIWETLKDTSMSAYKASTILKIMLEKLQNHQILREQLHNNFSFVSTANGVAPDGHVAPEHSAAMTLGMMSSGGMTPDAMGMYDRGYLQPRTTGLTPQPSGEMQGGTGALPVDGMGPFNNLFGQSLGVFQGMDLPNTNLDWDAWDTYIQGVNIDTSNQVVPFDTALLDSNIATTQTQGEARQQAQYQPAQVAWQGNSAGGFMGLGSPSGSGV